jgi:ankyrin repeat protein
MFTLVAKKDPSVEEIKILMREGVDINAKDKKGLTPLLQMAENKSGSGNALEIMNLLIQNGANVNSLDSNKGKNALLLLCDNHQNHQNENLKEITGLLMQSGLNVTPETVTFFKEKYHKENRDEILLLLDQLHPDEPVTKRMKFE